MRFLLVIAGLLAIGGCGPVQAGAAIQDGTFQLIEAERSGADKYARYEYYKARAFLEEAKLQNGFGSYATANRWRDLELRRLRGKQLLEKTRQMRQRTRRKAKPTKSGDPGKTTPPKITPPVKRRTILPPNMRKKPKGAGDK